jgi:hypothetical protein
VETALGRYELKTIRNALTSRDLIEEKLAGVPARLHYKINWETMKVSLAKAIVTHREGMSKRGAPTNQFVALPHTEDATGKDEASPRPTQATLPKPMGHRRSTSLSKGLVRLLFSRIFQTNPSVNHVHEDSADRRGEGYDRGRET